MLNFKHILTNLTGSVLPILVIFFTVPFYLSVVGAEKYGVLSIIWIVFGYFGILDFGISRAVTSFVSRAHGDALRKKELICSALFVTILLGVAIGVIGGVLYALLMIWTDSPVFQEVLPSLPLLMIGVPVVTVTSTLNGALDGEQRFKTANTIQVIGSVFYQVVPLSVAYWYGTELHNLIDAVIFCRILIMVIYAIVVFRVFGLSKAILPNRRTVKDLLKFGTSVAIVNIIDPLFSRMDQVVIAKFSGAESVAAYNIAVSSIGRLNIVPMAMSRALFPKMSATDIKILEGDIIVVKQKMMVAWFVICVVIILLSDIVFHYWLNNDISDFVSQISKIYIVGLWANCLGILPYTVLQASGRSNSIIRAHLFELPFYIATLLILTFYYGAVGAAIAYGLRTVADYLILWKMCSYPLGKQKLFLLLFSLLACVSLVSGLFDLR